MPYDGKLDICVGDTVRVIFDTKNCVTDDFSAKGTWLKRFLVIARKECVSVVSVPTGDSETPGIQLTKKHKERFGFDSKLLGSFALMIGDSCVYDVFKTSDGANCRKCNIFAAYACANQDDGTFLCYRCKSDPRK